MSNICPYVLLSVLSILLLGSAKLDRQNEGQMGGENRWAGSTERVWNATRIEEKE
jgi:hypothetical protein